MSRIKIILPAFVMAALLIYGCKSSKSTSSGTSSKVEKGTLTFEKDIKPIMETRCGGAYCHHGEPSEWMTYSNVKKVVDNGEFYEEVIEEKKMPPRTKLPTNEFNKIKEWLEAGAPE